MAAPLERVEGLTAERFAREFVLKRSVVFTEPTDQWRPEALLTKEVLLRHAAGVTVKVRPQRSGYLAAHRITEYVSLGDYYKKLERWERATGEGLVPPDSYPPYLHDSPILRSAPALKPVLGDFPKDYLPEWYRPDWWQFALFFIGTTNGTTPMHIDSCETNNLFFQVSGKKKWTIVPDSGRMEAFRINWHWSNVNVEVPTDEQRRLLESLDVREAEIGPGDILYMPPRTWHQVRVVEPGISFNIDWHTRSSATTSLRSVLRGSPVRNALAYNLPLYLGLTFGIPARHLMPWLELHLAYVD
jgi:hypothetical protein